jgi:CubicO group peptidase (beta-lactamase class C family)
MRFRIADVSRTLTSAAVGMLVDRKALDLDADVRTYVPDFPQKPWPITLRQLMSHTAGLINDQGDEEPIDEHCESTTDAFGRFAKHDLLFQPGTQYHESSYGWIVVSAAVEAAAHQRFFSFMRSEIFAPLGMADTLPDSFVAPPANRATFYYPRFAGDTRYGPELAREGDHSCFAGAYGFLSTPSDLVRFASAVESGKVVQPATLQTLQTPQRLASGDATPRGLGWTLDSVSLAGQPARMAGQGTKRDFIGGTAYLMTFPDRGLVVALTSNISFADLKTPALAVAQAFATQAGRSR